ncbi:MAG: M48 family metalloprotease [Planctomycetes bacterium]|nr:M48 family metalloprotease [Planctomycetota bacterium]MBL7044456.1 M48 family metalloprotease [Pirellulaceae bacterium]
MTLPISDFFHSALAQVWQIGALTLVVAFIVRRFCHRRPHLAYLLWMLVIVKCLTPPIWSSPVGLFSLAQIDVRQDGDASGTNPASGAGLLGPSGESPAQWTARMEADGGIGGATIAADAEAGRFPSATALSGWIWLAGTLLMIGVTVLGWARCRRTIVRCPKDKDAGLEQQITDLARRLRIRRPIEVFLSDEPVGPAVFGIFKPKLILPRTLLASRSFEQIEPVIAHELVHVRRHDAAMMLMELAAKIVWWFHPLVWWAGRHIGRHRERCCDAETVAGLACRPARYARCLLDVLEHKQELRTAFLLPGVRPVEVTSRRLEEIMRRVTTFRGRTPHYCWAIAILAALLVLPGSPLVIETVADPNDEITAEEVQNKLAKLESAVWQAGLSTDETKAFLKLAERVKCDEKVLMSLRANGKLSEVEAKGVDKLVSHFGNPVEDELAKLREGATQAGLTAEETKTAEKVAEREAFDEKAIIALYETGKLSEVEGKALEKLFKHFGHPYADELEKLTELAKEAGLTDAETETLKHGFVRAGCEVEKVVELKKSGGLSEKEATALKKLEAHLGKLEYHIDNPRDKEIPTLLKLARLAEMNEAETDAMMALFKRVDLDEGELLELKKSGKLSGPEAAAIVKLESIFGKLEDFAKNPRKEEISELLDASIQADLSLEETKAALKLAAIINFELEVAQRLKKAGRLTDVEAKALEKLQRLLER